MSSDAAITSNKNRSRRTNRGRGCGGKPSSNTSASIPDPNATINAQGGMVPEDIQETKEAGLQEQSGASGESTNCWICVEPIKYYAVSTCNHRTCHVCALRLRALYKNNDCTFCKLPQKELVFTTSADAPFSEYDLQSMTLKDVKLSVFFETQDIMDESLMLLRFNCPDPDCPFVARGWNDLKTHTKVLHKKMMCEICIRFKKVFAHEHTLYTTTQLFLHVPSLANRPQRNKDRSDDAHPLCEFCKECFFGDDELYAHMRERHEECFVCKRSGVMHQYFQDYKQLEQHFTSDHYPCMQAACLDKKFVVFGSAMDLQAHLVDEHGSNMTVKDRKEARKIATEFQFEDSGPSEGRRRRDREPPPSHSPRPPDRRRANFGASLTENDSNAAASGSSQTPRRLPSPPPSQENVDPAVAELHAAFMAKVGALTSNSTASEAAIRAAIKSYRAAESAARDLISTFYVVMDNNLEKTQSLIQPLVGLLDVEDKKKELLEAWNGFKVEQQKQFPDLVPAGSGSLYAGVASGRILHVKHASGQSSRVWDRVARAAASTSSTSAGTASSSRSSTPNNFPALFSSSSKAKPNVQSTAQRLQQSQSTSAAQRIAAVSSAQAPSTGVRSVTMSNNSSRPRSAGVLSASAFPALPTAAPQSKPQVSGNVSLRNIIGSQGPAVPAWGAGGNVSAASGEIMEPTEDANEDASQQGKGKGKGKGKKKITLFTSGHLPGQI